MERQKSYPKLLAMIEEGHNYREACLRAHLSRQAVWKKMQSCHLFRDAVNSAREAGREKRNYLAWLYHPFRGRRPPTGKGHGGQTQYSLR